MDVDDVRARLTQELAECFSRKLVMNTGKKGRDSSQPRLLDLRTGPAEPLDGHPP